MERRDIKSFTLTELETAMRELGEKPFRARQLYQWMHEKLAGSFDEMTSLSKELRRKLFEQFLYVSLKPVCEKVSKFDGTRKYLFALEDGHVIESVLMRYSYGNSVWGVRSAPRRWTDWSGTCAPPRCLTRFTGSRP